jgi:hypothetical protein
MHARTHARTHARRTQPATTSCRAGGSTLTTTRRWSHGASSNAQLMAVIGDTTDQRLLRAFYEDRLDINLADSTITPRQGELPGRRAPLWTLKARVVLSARRFFVFVLLPFAR